MKEIKRYQIEADCSEDVDLIIKQYNELVKLVKVLLENADEQVIDECVRVHIDDISALNSLLNEIECEKEK